EVRQVHEGQLGTLAIEDLGRRSGNPMRAGQPSARSPEGVERELSQFALEPVRQSLGSSGNPEHLVAVGAIIRFGRHANINRRSLVEPPKELDGPEGAAPL